MESQIMIDLLTEIAEFLDGQADADGTPEGYRPNRAMTLLQDVEREIERLKNAAPQVPGMATPGTGREVGRSGITAGGTESHPATDLSAFPATTAAATPADAALFGPSNWQWIPVGTGKWAERPREGSYLVANAKGQVAPWIRGVIHNNAGSAWDWEYGEAITHWMPLPNPPSSATNSCPETK